MMLQMNSNQVSPLLLIIIAQQTNNLKEHKPGHCDKAVPIKRHITAIVHVNAPLLNKIYYNM